MINSTLGRDDWASEEAGNARTPAVTSKSREIRVLRKTLDIGMRIDIKLLLAAGSGLPPG
jgi:hypothetical protein